MGFRKSLNEISLVCGLLLLPVGAQAECVYKIKDGSVKFQWTGYKFTKKLGVSGTFDGINWNASQKADSEDSLFGSLNYSVETASMNSGVPLRDKKLVLFLFGGIKNQGVISGKVTKSDLKGGKAWADIVMNGKTISREFKVKKSGAHYTFTSEIDLKEFGMMESVSRLAEACKALHTGTDGKSMTWSVVGLKIEADSEKVCS